MLLLIVLIKPLNISYQKGTCEINVSLCSSPLTIGRLMDSEWENKGSQRYIEHASVTWCSAKSLDLKSEDEFKLAEHLQSIRARERCFMSLNSTSSSLNQDIRGCFSVLF